MKKLHLCLEPIGQLKAHALPPARENLKCPARDTIAQIVHLFNQLVCMIAPTRILRFL
jgi:hypothetical protein